MVFNCLKTFFASSLLVMFVKIAYAADTIERATQGQFDARGEIPCAQYKGQPMFLRCPFGVARAGNERYEIPQAVVYGG